MSVETPSSTSSPDIQATADPLYLPFRPETFENATKAQRAILLAARDAALRGDTTQSEIAEIADVTDQYVTTGLMKFAHRKDLPVAYTLAHNCIAWTDHDDLTDLQERIIHNWVLRKTVDFLPELNQTELADHLNCHRNTIHRTLRNYNDIVEQLSSAIAPGTDTPYVPIEADDVPLDDLLKKTTDRDGSPGVLHTQPEDVNMSLLRPFSRSTLFELSPENRVVLLAAREWAIQDEPNLTAVANTADVSRSHVRDFISGYRHQDSEYPLAATVAKEFFPEQSYESLTPRQYSIVNAVVVNPNASSATIAAKEDNTSKSYVARIRKRFEGLIKKKREEAFTNNTSNTVTASD